MQVWLHGVGLLAQRYNVCIIPLLALLKPWRPCFSCKVISELEGVVYASIYSSESTDSVQGKFGGLKAAVGWEQPAMMRGGKTPKIKEQELQEVQRSGQVGEWPVLGTGTTSGKVCCS